jgi:hypothetical protein
MAVTNLTTLVLRGVTVVTGGVAVQTRRGWGYQALVQPPALVSMRHPSPGFAEPVGEPQRRFDADDQPAANTAPRAGRLSRCLSAGVLGSRSSVKWSPFPCSFSLSGGRLRRPAHAEKRTESAGLLPVAGTPTASTRGKGVCYT